MEPATTTAPQSPPLAPLQLDLAPGPFSPILPIDTSGLWGINNNRSIPRPAEATFTCTAADLRPEGSWNLGAPPSPSKFQIPPSMPGMQDFIAEAIRQGIAAGLQERAQLPLQPHSPATARPHLSPAVEESSPSPTSEEGETRDAELSGEEDQGPEKLASMGLFPPALFKPLLAKAKAALDFGPPASQATEQPSGSWFTEHRIETEAIPTPQIFVDAIQRQWATLTSGPGPLTNKKCFYNIEALLDKVLAWPLVDNPIVALYSAMTLPAGQEDLLKSEDRQADQVLHRGHQASAWSVRASTAALFFSRSCLSWLQQLQGRIPVADSWADQD